jgi:hypothetical protein
VEVAGRYQNPPARLEALLSHLPTWVRVDRLPAQLGGQVPVEKTLGSEGVADLIARYQAGASTRALARGFGIAKTTVINLLRRQEVGLRPRGPKR